MTKKQAEKELERAKVLFEEQCKNGASGGNIKFEAFAKQWFQEYAEHTLRPKTIERYKQFEERTYQAIGHLRLDKITPRQIQAFIHSLESDGLNQRTGGKLSPKTIKNNLSFISSIMDYAVSMFMIDSSPCRQRSQSKGIATPWRKRSISWNFWKLNRFNGVPFLLWLSSPDSAALNCWAWSGKILISKAGL